MTQGVVFGIFAMFIRKKKNRSGTTSIVVAIKHAGKIKELKTIGIAKGASEIDQFYNEGI